MESMNLTLDDVIQLTLEVGEDWAVAHAERLLRLIEQIGINLPYDPEVLELAAYLHDWGAFPRYIQKDVEHALRSRQVAEEEILPSLDLTDEQKQILEESRTYLPESNHLCSRIAERFLSAPGEGFSWTGQL